MASRTALLANLAESTIDGAINATVTSIVVQAGDGAKFPAPTSTEYTPAALVNRATGALEEINITARSTDTLTVVRGVAGSTAASWPDDAEILVGIPSRIIHGLQSTLHRDPSAVAMANTTTETDILSCTIPGGSIEDDGALRVTLYGKLFNDTGGNVTYRIRIKLGGTTIYNDLWTMPDNSEPRPFFATFLVNNRDSLSSQRGAGVLFVGPGAFASTGFGDLNSTPDEYDALGIADSTIDTSADQTLAVTLEMGTASATATYDHFYGVVERL